LDQLKNEYVQEREASKEFYIKQLARQIVLEKEPLEVEN
jgi:hypothetical protein